ncbi:hypothetical protein CEXT_28001 [Caerostris extrusa]|uniref:Uncharacterized protein n=1 Tax=Caerostris extrusa TaxID=172846 RepID=A0AAV4TVV1_CAEEX|nr:hypothetical protein CEXT_28001 [Caerostris extrusa]
MYENLYRRKRIVQVVVDGINSSLGLSVNDLEELLSLFTRNIRKCSKTPHPKRKAEGQLVPFWKDQNIEELIHERDSISQKLQVNNNEELRRKLVEVSHKVEDQISVCKQKKMG